MGEVKLSIIIPVYNAERSLDSCIGSIINQTYDNLEIILINDGSKDSSAKILKKWESRDNRIIVINQENKGAAAARNKGLDIASGTYIGFVDADDTIEQECYEQLLKNIISRGADIVSLSIKEIYAGDRIEVRENEEGLPVITGIEAAECMLQYEGGVRTVVWDKLYKAEVIGETRFTENYRFCEDALFNFKVMMSCRRYARISYIGYTYNHNMSQVTGGAYNHDSLSNIYGVTDIRNIYEDVIKDGLNPDQRNSLQFAINGFQLNMYRALFHSIILHCDYKKKYKNDYTELRDGALNISRDFVKRNLNFKDYIQWKLYLYCPAIFIIFHKINHIKNDT